AADSPLDQFRPGPLHLSLEGGVGQAAVDRAGRDAGTARGRQDSGSRGERGNEGRVGILSATVCHGLPLLGDTPLPGGSAPGGPSSPWNALARSAGKKK